MERPGVERPAWSTPRGVIQRGATQRGASTPGVESADLPVRAAPPNKSGLKDVTASFSKLQGSPVGPVQPNRVDSAASNVLVYSLHGMVDGVGRKGGCGGGGGRGRGREGSWWCNI